MSILMEGLSFSEAVKLIFLDLVRNWLQLIYNNFRIKWVKMDDKKLLKKTDNKISIKGQQVLII